jgi:hypothetical protein
MPKQGKHPIRYFRESVIMIGGFEAVKAGLGVAMLCGGAIVAAAYQASNGSAPERPVAPSTPAAITPAARAPASTTPDTFSVQAPDTPVPILAAAPRDEPLVIKRVLTIDGPFRHGDYVWDDKGVPPGPIVVTVDIGAQTLSVFRGGHEIGAAVILFGADNKPTPLGVFRISQKKAKHVSNLYNAPMPYMMRLTNDGVAIHGSNVQRDSATNGCVGVPTPFAKLLFGQIKLGDKVIITNGERLEVGGQITAA